ncbi:MAG: hypothetical protein LBG15_01850 [Dysgonamonadaceae bacterium]|nr:hypothetical protein [Dysgonamonadaceae bacterium]
MKKKILGGIIILTVIMMTAFNLSWNIQNHSFYSNLEGIEALGGELFDDWKYSTKQTKVTCYILAKDPKTGQPCYIEVSSTKTTCPRGGLPCTPFKPC